MLLYCVVLKVLINGTVKKVKSKAIIPQKIIVSFSRKMMEYQRFIRNRQIERAKKLLTKIDHRRLLQDYEN